MGYIPHVLLLIASACIIWFFAGSLIESIDRVAKRFHQTGFTVAFFVLGLLTSISEFSVMVNATLDNAPEVSVGNLVGASVVIILLIIPLLALMGKGVKLKNVLGKFQLLVALVTISLPAFFVLDGQVSRSEGLVCILVYCTLLFLIHGPGNKTVGQIVHEVEDGLTHQRRKNVVDAVKIMVGALFIFVAGNLLVRESVYFSHVLSIPSSIVGLLFLSIGTNAPELVIAIRSIMKKHEDIALGDYVGSAVANTLIFGLLPWLNGNFAVERSEFVYTAVLVTLGFVAFFVAARTKNSISRGEGALLLTFYVVFCILQFINLLQFATD